jgi:hypothetical protein
MSTAKFRGADKEWGFKIPDEGFQSHIQISRVSFELEGFFPF